MADDELLLERIKSLIEEEHELRSVGGPANAERVRRIEADLDVCWDLLRQRRARREFGENPGEAAPRPVSEVEGYKQ
ncbi:DUF2630 family protein [Actinocorallia lasiicapitis]